MERLLKKAINGDRFAIDDLTRKLQPRITKLAYYYAKRTGEDKDDLLQEGWLGLLEALPTLDLSIGSPEQYLIKRARWKMLDAIKYSNVRKCTQLEEVVFEKLMGSTCDNAFESVCATEFAHQLQSNQKEVLEQLLKGSTWREAGDKLGCASANIAYHVKKIRKSYKKYAAELAA